MRCGFLCTAKDHWRQMSRILISRGKDSDFAEFYPGFATSLTFIYIFIQQHLNSKYFHTICSLGFSAVCFYHKIFVILDLLELVTFLALSSQRLVKLGFPENLMCGNIFVKFNIHSLCEIPVISVIS